MAAGQERTESKNRSDEGEMRIETDSTIAAIATGAVGAIRGAIRITGPDTFRVLCEIFPGAADQWRRMKRATVVRSELLLESLGAIPVSVYSWPDHRSYTGQPSAELHLLGAPVLLERVQAKILEAGVRLAQPGEFTLRAFLAGRMDLTQCEAVLGLIHASGERAFQVALSQLAGGLAEPLKLIRRDLIELLADIEAGLDFVDEDIEFIASEQVIARLDRARVAIESLNCQLEQRAGQHVEFQVAVMRARVHWSMRFRDEMCRSSAISRGRHAIMFDREFRSTVVFLICWIRQGWSRPIEKHLGDWRRSLRRMSWSERISFWYASRATRIRRQHRESCHG